MQANTKKTYEYELCIAQLDPAKGAVRVSTISLSPTSAFSFGGGYGFCGLGICSIQVKRGQEQEATEQEKRLAQVPLMAMR
jgi:hypothetical protein